MKTWPQKYLPFCLVALLAHCSTFYGGSTSSTGNQSISEDAAEVVFETNVNTTIYKTVTFTNRSDTNYNISNLALVDNDCGAFSVYSIMDEAGNTLYKSGQTFSVGVVSAETIEIAIRFSPTDCAVTEYTTTLVIYYDAGEESLTEAVSLVARVEGSTVAEEEAECTESAISYYDAYDNPTERTLPPLDDGEKYYLKIDKMNAYIQTTGGFASYATQVGTEMFLDEIDEEDWFEPVFIPISTDAESVVTVATIDRCLGFRVPAPKTDPFFLGADLVVTSTQEFFGTIDRADEPGKFEIPGMELHLYSFINDSGSLLQSSDGLFEVDILTDLATGETAENDYLEARAELTDDDGNPFLNISDGKLYGKNIRHGTITLVGIGQFINKDTAVMSNEGLQALFENDAYLFLQIEGTVTQAVGE